MWADKYSNKPQFHTVSQLPPYGGMEVFLASDLFTFWFIPCICYSFIPRLLPIQALPTFCIACDKKLDGDEMLVLYFVTSWQNLHFVHFIFVICCV